MARSPEKSGPSRRGLLIIAAGATAAGAALLLRNKGKKEADYEPVQRKGPAQKEGRPERIRKPRERGARGIFREQIEKGEEPTLGSAEVTTIDTDWHQQFKTRAGAAWIGESKGRIEGHVDNDQTKSTYVQAIEAAFKQEGVPTKYLYLAFVESQFKTYDESGRPVRSRTGAIGAYQFQEVTAVEYGLKITRDAKKEIVLDERLDPVKAAGACARYLRYFAHQFKAKGAMDDDAWMLAAHAYNGGFAQTYLLRNQRVSLSGFYQHMQQDTRGLLVRAMSPRQHIVKSGDTLLKIAARNQMQSAAVRKANPAVNWSSLRIGSSVTIPGLNDTGPVHMVRQGDTLPALLTRYQIRDADIRKANPQVSDWSTLNLGAEIKIPSNSGAFVAHINAAKLGLLRGHVENIDYVAKFKAVASVVGA